MTMFKEGDRPSKDSRFLSGIAREHIQLGGLVIYVWLQTGIVDQTPANGEPVDPMDAPILDTDGNPVIQDAILMENRDRKYAEDAVKLFGAMQVSQNALDFARFGMLSTDVVQMEFHKEYMEKQCGRRLRPGDVVEMTHLHDVGLDGRPMNRWYEIKSLVKSPRGFDHTFDYHIIAVTMKPMKDAQEFADLMNRETGDGTTLKDSTSNYDNLMSITAENQENAFKHAYTTWWDTTPIYIDPDTTLPYRWTDDAQPPNGLPVVQVSSFPSNPDDGDYIIRIDMYPNKLYRYQAGKWIMKEVDRKREWNTYNWVVKLREFASDQSQLDDLRPWNLASIHDIQTPREGASKPSPRGSGVYGVPNVGTWTPFIPVPSSPPSYNPPAPTTYTVMLASNTGSPINVSSELNVPIGEYAIFHVQYTLMRGMASQIGEIMISDDGNNTGLQVEYNNLAGDPGVTFSVTESSGMRLLRYVTTSGGVTTMTFRVDSKW